MRSVLIIGMGEFGKHLGYRLLELKASVCVVDSDKDLINALSDDFENALVSDCTKDTALRDLGVSSFDICVVSIGKDFQTSLEITSKLRDYGAKYIIARAFDDLQSKFLKMAGADETVYPAKDIANRLAIKCSNANLLNVFEIADGYSVFEIVVRKEWVGKSLRDSNIRKKYELNVIAVKNPQMLFVPDVDYIFAEDDTLVVFGRYANAKKIK